MADKIRFDEVNKHLDEAKRTLEKTAKEVSEELKRNMRDRSQEISRMLLDEETTRFFQEKITKTVERELGNMIDERIERSFNDRMREVFDHFKQAQQYLERTQKDIDQILAQAQQK